VIKHWNRLLKKNGEVLGSPFLEVLRTHLDKALSNLLHLEQI